MPASRRQRATILAPRSWPSRPTLAISTRMGLSFIVLASSSWTPILEDRRGPRRGSRRSSIAVPYQDRGPGSRRALGTRSVRVANGAGGVAMRDSYYLTDEQRMIRDLARQIAREKIAPLAAQTDETESFPGEQMRLLAQQGLFGIWVPEAYGGTDMGCLALSLVAEEIAWACAATATQFIVQPLGGLPILLSGTEAQKRRYLPRLATGEILAAYSLSEPNAGSDAASLRTTAVRRGDHYILNGSKQWCSNGDHAGVITLFATVDRAKRAKGVTAFLVEPDMPGFSVGKKERKMGIRGSPTVALHLSDCTVPVENRLGDEGEGFTIAMRTLDMTRPPTGAMAVGIGQAALDASIAYAKERRQFDAPIASFQGIQFMLADMAMQVHGARLMV